MQRRSFLSALATIPFAAPVPFAASAQPPTPAAPGPTVRTLWSLTLAEVASILEVCRKDAWAPPEAHFTGPWPRAAWWGALLRLHWDAGLRFEQLLQLRRRDVDFSARRIPGGGTLSESGKWCGLRFGDRTAAFLSAGMAGPADSPLFPWTGCRQAFYEQYRKIWTCAGLARHCVPGEKGGADGN